MADRKLHHIDRELKDVALELEEHRVTSVRIQQELQKKLDELLGLTTELKGSSEHRKSQPTRNRYRRLDDLSRRAG